MYGGVTTSVFLVLQSARAAGISAAGQTGIDSAAKTIAGLTK